MAKPITAGSFNDPRATAKLVGGQKGYASLMAEWRKSQGIASREGFQTKA